MENNIKEYAFVDCLFIDFGVDKLASSIYLVVEAYYPSSDSMFRKKGLIRVTLNGISRLTITKDDEFDSDISAKYDTEGEDQKANEVYSIDVELLGNKKQAVIDSDMLKLKLSFKNIFIEELN